MNPVHTHGPLKVSRSGRYLAHQDDTPFFWLADTAWELFHKLSREETLLYLQNRAAKGFSVIQAVALAELDGLRSPNAYGAIPFEDEDPARPQENYFSHIDWVLSAAAEAGLYIGLLPTWGDKVHKRYDWAKGPEIFTPGSAERYGCFLGERYRHTPNIIWILGGDRNPGKGEIAVWRAMAAGIRRGLGEDHSPLMTFHPQPFDGGSSAGWFHTDSWLSFNMLQTGHGRDTPVYDIITTNYHLQPAKPILDGEPTYEAHPIDFKPFEKGYSTAMDVRKYAYWSLFSGACGHTYGCHSIWQFHRSGDPGVNYPLYDWLTALDLEGASQLQHLKNLLADRPLDEFIPDQSVLNEPQQKNGSYCTAFRATDGSRAYIYAPAGGPLSIDTASLKGTQLLLRWFNPKDGSYTEKIIQEKSPHLHASPPFDGPGCDWVLVLDASH